MGQDQADNVHTSDEAIADPPAPKPVVTDLSEEAAKLAWDTYRAAVGGKAFNGDPLPDWATMVADENKKLLVAAWRATANKLATYWQSKLNTASYIRSTLERPEAEAMPIIHEIAEAIRELDKFEPGWDCKPAAGATTSPVASEPPVASAS